MTDLGTLPDDVGSNAIVADEGRVVGVSGDSSGNVRGFLWENGGPMVDLSTLISPDSVLAPVVPFAINDRAEIAGTGLLPNGDAHAFLLIPCDANHLNVEGCDYSLADAVAPPSSARPAVRPTSGEILRFLGRRNPQFRFPKPGLNQ